MSAPRIKLSECGFKAVFTYAGGVFFLYLYLWIVDKGQRPNWKDFAVVLILSGAIDAYRYGAAKDVR